MFDTVLSRRSGSLMSRGLNPVWWTIWDGEYLSVAFDVFVTASVEIDGVVDSVARNAVEEVVGKLSVGIEKGEPLSPIG